MPDLIENSLEASAWVKRTIAAHRGGDVFGHLAQAVVWTNDTNQQGELLVDCDPQRLAATINAEPFPLLVGHDPGRPAGKVLAAKTFTGEGGKVFVAAVIGFYDGAPRLRFDDLGQNPLALAQSPARLPALTDNFSVALAADPREFEAGWLEEVAGSAPVRVELEGKSHNAADAPHQLITVGVLFMTLVWNPLVTTIANEAGKDVYAAVRAWLRTLIGKAAECANPIVEIQSHHSDCVISFMLRGTDVAQHYQAHAQLSEAAARAEELIARLTAAGSPPVRLLYEFEASPGIWFPAFAELADGRLVTDNTALIAAEQFPAGLSLGLPVKALEAAEDKSE